MQLNNGITKWGKLSWNCFAICDVNNTTDPENVFFFQRNKETFNFDKCKIAVYVNWRLLHVRIFFPGEVLLFQ